MSVELSVAKPNENYEVNGHDLRLGQVVNNLIDNAVSFSPEGGKVRVSLKRTPDSIIVSVEDEGPGIAADVFERIFERFYTDRPGADSFGENSGLGLSIAKQIVEAHGGKIAASNRHADDGRVAGARFEVLLPARNKRRR